MSEFIKRTIIVVIGIPLALLIIYAGGSVFAIGCAVISSMALWEFYTMTRKKNAFVKAWLGVATNCVLLGIIFLGFENIIPAKSILVSYLTVLLCAFLFNSIIMLFSHKPNPILSITAFIGGIVYITIPISLLLSLREFSVKPELFLLKNVQDYMALRLSSWDALWSIGLIISIFVSIWSCDIAAYLAGRSLGRHKLLERVSPKKTIEGAIFGLAGAMAGFAIPMELLAGNFPLVHSLTLGALIGVSGQLGDLFESLLKRDAGVKDSSNIIPGHGGVLDRFDSLLFAVPVVFIYLLCFLLTY